jgi:predicted nucleic acid-binding protein
LTRLVVDASVAIKWLLPEENSEAAARLLSGSWSLQAPDLLWAESGNILWKKWRREELAAEAVPDLIADLKRFPLRIYPSEPLCHLAWDVARRFSRSFYDSLYVALSVSTSCSFVTADLRMYNALRGATPELNLLWVGDIT